MWSLLSKLLECVAGFRFPYLWLRKKLAVGNNVPDAKGTADWKNYLDGRTLSRVWGPHANSPWKPFHVLTLFVALDHLKLKLVGPLAADPWPVDKFKAPAWIDSQTFVIVDLPGPKSVAVGAALGMAGCDLVCTFNNWPNALGLLKSEHVLAALLRYASLLDEKRVAYPTPAPMAWLCDWDRLGTRNGKPGEFDNRYYIEEGLMPGPNLLRTHGVTRVVYVTSRPDTPVEPKADISAHLRYYQENKFEVLFAFALDDGTFSDTQSLILPPKPFSTTGFFRSSAGGFGAPVPHPSSGG